MPVGYLLPSAELNFMKTLLTRQSFGHTKDEKTDTYDYSCNIVQLKGNHEHEYERYRVDAGQQGLELLVSFLTGTHFFHCGSFIPVLALVWTGRAMMDMFRCPGHALLHLRTGLLVHVSRWGRLQRPHTQAVRPLSNCPCT